MRTPCEGKGHLARHHLAQVRAERGKGSSKGVSGKGKGKPSKPILFKGSGKASKGGKKGVRVIEGKLSVLFA